MSSSTNLIAALAHSHFDAIDGYPKLGSSYWASVRETAPRRERLTVEAHCRQIAFVGREGCGIVKILDDASDKARCSA
jgi:hypothetical protein